MKKIPIPLRFRNTSGDGKNDKSMKIKKYFVHLRKFYFNFMFRNNLNLRKAVTIAVCLASSITMSAQDIIVMKNGNEIQAVVKEVGPEIVKYMKYDNPNGPIYIKIKSEVSMIKYENGSQDVFVEDAAPSIAVKQKRKTTVNYDVNPYNNIANSQQQPSDLKYTFGKRISPYGSDRSPFLAGFLSFLVPGAGQFYNGDVAGGFLFLGSNIVFNSIWMNSIKTDYYGNSEINGSQFAVGFIGALTINVWSIVDGVQGAKKVNIARGYRLGNNTYVKIQPTIIPQDNLLTNKEYAYGMNFRLNF